MQTSLLLGPDVVLFLSSFYNHTFLGFHSQRSLGILVFLKCAEEPCRDQGTLPDVQLNQTLGSDEPVEPLSGRDETRGHGHKLTQRLPPNVKKCFFSVRETEQCHKLLVEDVESLSLAILKSHLDTVLGTRWPCLSRGFA